MEGREGEPGTWSRIPATEGLVPPEPGRRWTALFPLLRKRVEAAAEIPMREWNSLRERAAHSAANFPSAC